MRFPGAVLLLLLISAGRNPAQSPLPVSADFGQRIKAAARLDSDIQHPYTYQETRRDVRISALGKVIVGPLRTFEVFPSTEPGDTYKRLIAVNGARLSNEELARRDAEHQRNVEDEARKRQRETPEQRARRIDEATSDDRNALAILEDAFAVFKTEVQGREWVDGESVIVVSMAPQQNARVKTREGDWMKNFEGRGWFTESDAQLTRLDMHAVDDVSIGWGIVGRIHEGTRLVVERKRVGTTWLPFRQSLHASGRTLLFRTFQVDLITEYGGYKLR